MTTNGSYGKWLYAARGAADLGGFRALRFFSAIDAAALKANDESLSFRKTKILVIRLLEDSSWP